MNCLRFGPLPFVPCSFFNPRVGSSPAAPRLDGLRDHQDDMTAVKAPGFRTKPSFATGTVRGPHLIYTFVKDLFFVAIFFGNKFVVFSCFFAIECDCQRFFWHFELWGFKSVYIYV